MYNGDKQMMDNVSDAKTTADMGILVGENILPVSIRDCTGGSPLKCWLRENSMLSLLGSEGRDRGELQGTR